MKDIYLKAMFSFNILNRFLMRRFFSGVGLVMLVVCGIILAVTFVERLPANPTVIETVADAWMRLLEYVPLFLPMAVFMGTLLVPVPGGATIIDWRGADWHLCNNGR